MLKGGNVICKSRIQKKYNMNVNQNITSLKKKEYYFFVLNTKNCPLGCLSQKMQKKPCLILMRNFPENISQCIKEHHIPFYDQRSGGMRVKQWVQKGDVYSGAKPHLFYFPKASPIHFLPSHRHSSVPLMGFITS